VYISKTLIKILTVTLTLSVLNSAALGWSYPTLVTQESWSKHALLKGTPAGPVIIDPPALLSFSERTKKVIVVPEELKMEDEIGEFRMFRNRYVIFGIYLFTSLYYNWLTRHR
jgi:hypothetical protein